MGITSSLLVQLMIIISVLLPITGCTGKKSMQIDSPDDNGPNKEVHTDLHFYRLTDTNQIDSAKKISDVYYLGQDGQDHHWYSYCPMKNGRLQVSVFSIKKNTVNRDKLLSVEDSRTITIQQPCPTELMEWAREKSIQKNEREKERENQH